MDDGVDEGHAANCHAHRHKEPKHPQERLRIDLIYFHVYSILYGEADVKPCAGIFEESFSPKSLLPTDLGAAPRRFFQFLSSKNLEWPYTVHCT